MEQDNNNALMFKGVFPYDASAPCLLCASRWEWKASRAFVGLSLHFCGSSKCSAQNSDRNEWGEPRMCGQHRPGRERRRREGNTPLKLKGV